MRDDGRILRLQAAQVRDGVEDRHVGVIEQQLSGKRRAVERPGVENGHRLMPQRARRPIAGVAPLV